MQAPTPRVVYVDVETQRSAQEVGGWRHAARMGLSVAIVFDALDDTFAIYTEDSVADLLEHLRSAALVVGFNLIGFDLAVLSAYTDSDLAKELACFDLLEDLRARLGWRPKLDNLARENLGAGKSADGLQAIEWWKTGRFDLLGAYCTQDVRLLREVFRLGVHRRALRVRDFRGRLRLVETPWNLRELVEQARAAREARGAA